MPVLKDYYGNPIVIPDHEHAVSDTLNNDNTTALATAVIDGFMSKETKIKLNNTLSKSNQLFEKIKTAVFIQYNTATLAAGSVVRNAITNLSSTATSIVFTTNPIPTAKIASAKLVSDSTSDINIYAYLDGTTIYFAPEKENTIIYAPVNCDSLFVSLSSSIKTIKFDNFDTSKTTSMVNMFTNSSALTSLDLSYFNTSKVTTVKNLFSSCTSLEEVNLISFNFLNITDTSYMFSNCSKLKSIIMPMQMYTAKLVDASYMFKSCTLLTSLDLSGLNTSALNVTSQMFYGCTNLSCTITISNPNLGAYSNMFNGCSTATDAEFIVNYTSGSQAKAQTLVATKSSNSNVVLGSQVTL